MQPISRLKSTTLSPTCQIKKVVTHSPYEMLSSGVACAGHAAKDRTLRVIAPHRTSCLAEKTTILVSHHPHTLSERLSISMSMNQERVTSGRGKSAVRVLQPLLLIFGTAFKSRSRSAGELPVVYAPGLAGRADLLLGRA